jgi:hypothetical protein
MLNRRNFLKVSLGGATVCVLDSFTPMVSWAAQNEPHYFVHLVFSGGFDCSYLFDGRPMSMTKAKKIQNYSGVEPTLWEGSNGTPAWAAVGSKALEPFKNDITIVNGVVMTPAFDGHLQNMNYLLTGNPFGGESFMPHLNTEGIPLDGIISGDLYADQVNFANFVPLTSADAKTLVESVRSKVPLDPSSQVWQFITSRYAANSGKRSFSSSAARMNSSIPSAAKLEDYIRGVELPASDTISFMDVVGQFFKKGISRSAVISENIIGMDAHAAVDARRCPGFAETIAARTKEAITFLKNTPYDDKRSLFDVTTLMVSSEFSRTMLQKEADFEDTGTDHNNFNNSIILAGKKIKMGQVIGQSDWRTEDEVLSKAHLAMDDGTKRIFGKPFDFTTGKPRTDLPEEFKIQDYLTVGSVINTLYSAFGVEEKHYREFERNAGKPPVISQLLNT